MTPVEVQLDSIVKSAVKMFEIEAKSAGVDLDFKLDDSCARMKVDRVSLDPTRVLQILINLLTNAIKFTRLEVERSRHISVRLSVSTEQPKHDGRVSFMSASENAEAPTLLSDWEEGNLVSLLDHTIMEYLADYTRYTLSFLSKTRVEA